MYKKEYFLIESLYNKYKFLLYKEAYNILHDKSLAEDMVKQTFIKIMDNIHKIKDIDSAETRNYLCIICRNLSINFYNKNKRISIYDKDDMIDIKSRLEDDFNELIIDNENVELLKKAVNKLPVIYRDVLILEKIKDNTIEDIAKILDISIDAVRKRSQRARKLIMEILEKDGVINNGKKRK